MTCTCGGKEEKKKLEVRVYDISVGEFDGFKCTKCSEEWFEEETVETIEKKTQEMGLFGLSKREKVGVAGNSLIIRIPKQLAEFVDVEKGDLVTVEPEGRRKIAVEVL